MLFRHKIAPDTHKLPKDLRVQTLSPYQQLVGPVLASVWVQGTKTCGVQLIIPVHHKNAIRTTDETFYDCLMRKPHKILQLDSLGSESQLWLSQILSLFIFYFFCLQLFQHPAPVRVVLCWTIIPSTADRTTCPDSQIPYFTSELNAFYSLPNDAQQRFLSFRRNHENVGSLCSSLLISFCRRKHGENISTKMLSVTLQIIRFCVSFASDKKKPCAKRNFNVRKPLVIGATQMCAPTIFATTRRNFGMAELSFFFSENVQVLFSRGDNPGFNANGPFFASGCCVLTRSMSLAVGMSRMGPYMCTKASIDEPKELGM